MQNHFGKLTLGAIMIIFITSLTPNVSNAQDFIENATVQGNIYSEANYYFTDTLIGADKVPEYIRANIYGNIFYRYINRFFYMTCSKSIFISYIYNYSSFF